MKVHLTIGANDGRLEIRAVFIGQVVFFFLFSFFFFFFLFFFYKNNRYPATAVPLQPLSVTLQVPSLLDGPSFF